MPDSNKQGRQKLTEEDVREIKQMLRDGFTIQQIAYAFDLSDRYVRYIREGKHWPEVEIENGS